ncbi:hypothetical protein OnM2_026024 [Erysiphe neolycopersici]|uniref:Uncharacterized protein n=1 Tax=Erysiphe neolycopersici TaxID=212602 RepID=A0A420I0P1_9PEZI|nr:hypothetical protein OnM2_026024 [Erysiphe neolycopersici]
MCKSYTSKAIKSPRNNLRIPADGNVFVVSDMKLGHHLDATITSQEAWASLIAYARHMEVIPEVEKAMVIARSLAENKYCRKAALTKVVSGADLIRPLMSIPPSSSSSKPMVTLEMAVIVVRMH